MPHCTACPCQVSALIEELAKGGAAELGITLQPGTVERLLAYGRSVAHYPTAVKEVSYMLSPRSSHFTAAVEYAL